MVGSATVAYAYLCLCFPASFRRLGHAPFFAYGAGFAAGYGEFCET